MFGYYILYCTFFEFPSKSSFFFLFAYFFVLLVHQHFDRTIKKKKNRLHLDL